MACSAPSVSVSMACVSRRPTRVTPAAAAAAAAHGCSTQDEIRKASNMSLVFSLRSRAKSNSMEQVKQMYRASQCESLKGYIDFIEMNMFCKHSLVVEYRKQEFIVSQIELYSGPERMVMLVELVEMNIIMRVFELLENLKELFKWMQELVERVKSLRLGRLLHRAYAHRMKPSSPVEGLSPITSFKVSEHLENFANWRWKKFRADASNGYIDPDSEQHRHQVHCNVEAISWRERYISGSISINAEVDCVWKVLTDYERLAEFIPNLVQSVRIPCPYPNRTWLLQRGLHAAMYWHIEASAVLDLEEFPYSVDGKALQFGMVDGDFKKFTGRWLLQAGSRPGTTMLHYQVNVIPRLLLPGIFVERIIMSDLPLNLRAIADRAESFPSVDHTEITLPVSVQSKLQLLEKLPVQVLAKDVAKRTCKPEGHCAVDEVHLRRVSEENGECWRVMAAVTIKASCEDVWNILTSYEELPEFVPNLSSSKVLSRDGQEVRVLQEGCKCLLYMVLHARVVLELREMPSAEILFKQVEGDFDFLVGKMTLESLGSKHTVLKYLVDMRLHNDFLLPREILEEVVYEDLPENLCALRARVELGENCVVDDDDDESPGTATISEPATNKTMKLSKPGRKPIQGLQRDFKVLERELRRFMVQRGNPRVMPVRKQLREHGRVDLEKSIARFGGFSTIAASLNLELAYKQRKPRGYWDDIENLRQEILRFQEDNALDKSCMPGRKCFEQAGRYDLARALEKWGGLYEAAKILGLKTRLKGRTSRSQREQEGQASPKVAAAVKHHKQQPQQMQQQHFSGPLKTSLPKAPSKWMKVDKET